MRLVLLACALALPAAAAAAERPEVLVLKSDSLGPYASAIAGFAAECRGEVTELDLQQDPEGERLAAELERRTPALIFALGPRAANIARRTFDDVPIVFALVPNWEKYGLEGKNVTGVALQQPVRTQLQTLKALAGGARRVGVLYTPRYSKSVVAAAQEGARALALQLVAAKVESAEDIPAAVSGLAGKVDALWMIADRSVANPAAARSIIAFALAQKVPVFALSEQQVREGALVSLSPNYAALGQQAGRIANRILADKASPAAIPVAQPEGLDLAINLSTARKIGAECSLALEIFKYAARQGFPIRVFE